MKYIAPLLLIILISCQQQTQKETAPQRINIALQGEPTSFHPYSAGINQTGEWIAMRLFPSLFIEEPIMEQGLPKLTPYLADHWQWNEPKTQLELTIKKGLKWQDGHPLSTEDILYTFQLQTDKEIGWFSSGSKDFIESMEIMDAHTLKITFNRVSAFNLHNLNEGMIVPKHYSSKFPISAWETRDWSQDLVTFGPYILDRYTAGQSLSLKPRNAGLPQLGFATVKDKETHYQLLAGGEMDYSWSLPIRRMNQMEPPVRAITYPNMTFGFIGWNPITRDAFQPDKTTDKEALAALIKEQPHPLFSDVRIRQAMTFIFDRESYVRQLWHGSSSVPVSPWAAGLPYLSHHPAPRQRNLEEAAKRLQAAGFTQENGTWMRNGQPFKFSILCNAGSYIREQYLLLIQQDLKAFGIEMEIEFQEVGQYLSNFYNHQFDACFGAFGVGTRPYLMGLFHSNEAFGGQNVTSWISVDSMLETAQRAQNAEQLQQVLAELEQRFIEEQPMTLLYTGQTVGGISPRLKTVTPNALDPMRDIENWLK